MSGPGDSSKASAEQKNQLLGPTSTLLFWPSTDICQCFSIKLTTDQPWLTEVSILRCLRMSIGAYSTTQITRAFILLKLG
jgi:ABC-type uncharacterized transport system permease subunit